MSEWPRVKLGDVLVLEYGKPLAGDQRSSQGEYLAYGANGVKARTDEYHVDGESIIVGRKGSAGALARVSGRWWPLDVTYYVSHQMESVDIEYLYFAMQSLNLPSLASGVKPGINRNDVYALEIPLPPLDEQKRIVAKLDQAQSKLDRLESKLDLQLGAVDGLERAALNQEIAVSRVEQGNTCSASEPAVSGWPLVKLGEICDLYQPETISRKQLNQDGQYVVYGANGPIGSYDRFNHEESEVTMTCRGATCGRINVTPPKVWITGNAMVIRPKSEAISKEFLASVLPHLDLSQTISGTAQPQITRKSLSPLLVPVPPLDEQKRIVAKLDAVQQELAALRERLYERRSLALSFRDRTLAAALVGDL